MSILQESSNGCITTQESRKNNTKIFLPKVYTKRLNSSNVQLFAFELNIIVP